MPARDPLRHLRAPSVAQFVKYGIVGVLNTLLSVAIILVGAWIGVWHIAAYAVAYAIGAVNGYLINRSWTFRSGAGHRATATRYFIVQGLALLVSTGLVYLLVDVAGLANVPGQLIAIGVAVVGGFMANRWWTFAGDRAPPVAAEHPAAVGPARSVGR